VHFNTPRWPDSRGGSASREIDVLVNREPRVTTDNDTSGETIDYVGDY
jgi:hypothetical protein